MAVITTTYYTLNDCCTDEPIDWPANEGSLQGTFYLEFNGFCNEGDFDYIPCPNDLTNLIITEIVNEAQLNITGCLKLTSVSITEIPGDADIADWEDIMTEVTTVPTCEECQTCPVYYTLNDCCTGEPFLINPDTVLYLKFTGSCEFNCPEEILPLTITSFGAESGFFAIGCFKLTEIQDVPPGSPTPNYTTFINDITTTVPTCAECQECCYTLTNCETDQVIESNTSTLPLYLNKTVKLNGYDGCWQVEKKQSCDCVKLIFFTEGDPSPQILQLNIVTTYNGRNVYADINSFLYLWWAIDKWVITQNNYGPSAGDVKAQAFNLDVDCPISSSSSWDDGVDFFVQEIAECPAECTCPVPVTVLQSFDDCPSCLPIVAYKFTNCNNQSLVKYSSDDFSEYIGKTVELDCGDCWFVEKINYTPPSTQTIEIAHTFDTCVACNRTYYKLTDCLDPNVNIIYTYTDLSEYLDKTIKIKGCDSCFTVLEETREPINPGIVEVTDSYIDCPECLETFPCVCSVISNTTDTEQTYCYINCDFEQQSIVLQPGEKSDKVCVIKWIVCHEPCDCLTTTYYQEEIADPTNNITLNLELLPTGETYNGKPIYQDCFNSNPACDIPFPTDSCFTVKYELDGCWYGAFTNNCVTDINAVFKNCSNTDCPTGEWEYIPCTRLKVLFKQEQGDVIAIFSVVDYTVSPFTYVVDEYTISYNSSTNLWEMAFEGEVFRTISGNVDICGIDGEPVQWGTDFFAPTSVDPDVNTFHTLNVERCNTQTVATEIQGYIEYFGDCVNNQCPVKPLPKRKVKPGYSTPSCDIEKYEKITCKSSEIYYKQVMRLRYGISNCCPEDEEKWLIKKELIDLQSLVDPDYICKPVTTCCNQPLSTCGCSCNQTLKTCNS